MKHRSAPPTNWRGFSLSLSPVFPHSPKIVVFTSTHPGQLTREVQEKGHTSLGDGEGQAWGLQGQSETRLWMTTACCGAGPRGAGCSLCRWEPEHIISEGRVSELQFNKPSTAPLPIPRKLINVVGCHGSVCLRWRGSAATLHLHQCQGGSFMHQPSLFHYPDLTEMLPAFRELAQA